MVGESFKEQPNPVKFGSDKIRLYTQALVGEQMQGIFPRNYVYAVGNYDLIYLPISLYGNQADGFAEDADMIVVNSKGEFKSGRVNQKVLSDRSRWEFRDAKLQDATGLQIVRYGPRLIGKLFSQLQSEMLGYEEPEKIARGLQVLDKRILAQTQLAAISRKALNEMGEEGEPEVSVPTDIGGKIMAEAGEIISAMGFKSTVKLPDFAQMKKTFSLYMNREKLVEEIKQLASNMRAKPVEDKIAVLASQIMEIDAGDKAAREDQDGNIWFVPGQDFGRERIYAGHHGEEGWVMAVSRVGVREVKLYDRSDSPRECPEHVLETAGQVAAVIIGRSVGEVFPELKWQEIKPPVK